MIQFKTIRQFAAESGYTEGAIREKIRKGVFLEDKVWLRGPDNRILINIIGFNEWVTNGQEFLSQVKVALPSASPINIYHAKSELKQGVSPLVLT